MKVVLIAQFENVREYKKNAIPVMEWMSILVQKNSTIEPSYRFCVRSAGQKKACFAVDAILGPSSNINPPKKYDYIIFLNESLTKEHLLLSHLNDLVINYIISNSKPEILFSCREKSTEKNCIIDNVIALHLMNFYKVYIDPNLDFFVGDIHQLPSIKCNDIPGIFFELDFITEYLAKSQNRNFGIIPFPYFNCSSNLNNEEALLSFLENKSKFTRSKNIQPIKCNNPYCRKNSRYL